MTRSFLFLLFFLITFLSSRHVSCQVIEEISPYYQSIQFVSDSSAFYSFNTEKPITGIILRSAAYQNFSDAYIILDSDTIYLKKDIHNSNNHQNASQLILINTPKSTFEFYSGKITGETGFHILHAGNSNDPEQNLSAKRTESSPCGQLAIVRPDQWRQGLPEPKGTPLETDVEHIIIHHSASSNSSADYLNEVRNIYLFHTQVQGWDDIGYNFLITPDGSIFQGRDSKNLFDSDNAQGAHMCGRNAGTTGICLLGDFSRSTPTDAALESLYNLCAWKASKEFIDIMDSSIHQMGPPAENLPDKLLPHLAGHRDGCREGYTVCPGNGLYQLLPSIRNIISAKIQECPNIASTIKSSSGALKIHPQPANTYVYIKSIKPWSESHILSVNGTPVKKLLNSTSSEDPYNIADLPSGVYILAIFYTDGSKGFEKLILE